MSENTAPGNAGGIARGPVIETLLAEWASLGQLLQALPPDQWLLPTCLPGWTVSDIVAHLIGTEAMLAGEALPAVAADVSARPHVNNDIAKVNEIWVESLRGTPAPGVLARFRDVTARRAAMLKQMSQADFDAPSWTPVGQATYGRFMQVRIYDCWMHEQDIRAAVGLPGNQDGPAARAALAETTRALGYIIGKRAAAPDGASVLLDLTGSVHQKIAVTVNGRARVIPELPGPASVTLRMPAWLFLRLTGGRCAAAQHHSEIEITGDAALADRILGNLAFTI